jgi:hypothetical protein
MRQFKWIEWNLDKIDAHALSAEEVEAYLIVFSVSRNAKTVRTRCLPRRPRAAGSG